MSILTRLERRFGRFAVTNVTVGIIVLQVFGFGLTVASRAGGGNAAAGVGIEPLLLVPDKVLDGEVWRLVTFVAIPPFANLLCLLFGWYLFYLFGTALEHFWGAFRYNVFLSIGYVATVGAAFVTPQFPASNGFLYGSVFLAFAALCPEFTMYLFFILPVKIKWLALLTWIGYGLAVLFGGWQVRMLIVASVLNFLLFFGNAIYYRIRGGRRHMAGQIARMVQKEPAYFHKCTVCGKTDKSHPDLEFRYCSGCDGDHGYCMDHLRDHEHVTAEGNAEVESGRN
jgi:hypothetical protein